MAGTDLASALKREPEPLRVDLNKHAGDTEGIEPAGAGGASAHTSPVSSPSARSQAASPSTTSGDTAAGEADLHDAEHPSTPAHPHSPAPDTVGEGAPGSATPPASRSRMKLTRQEPPGTAEAEGKTARSPLGFIGGAPAAPLPAPKPGGAGRAATSGGAGSELLELRADPIVKGLVEAARETKSLSNSPEARKRKREEAAQRPIDSLKQRDVGKVMEMLDDEANEWRLVRVVDVINWEVQVCPEYLGAHAQGPRTLQWVDFEAGRFRTAPPAHPTAASGSPEAPGPEDGSGRSVRSREAPPRAQRLAATPEARAQALERGGCGVSVASPEQLRVRDRSRDRRRERDRRRNRSSEARSPTLLEPPQPPQPPPAPARKRDWGLMQVDVVGRNRPPFAKTLLCHGVVQPGVRLSGEGVPAGNWVVKRWPDKPARRRVDIEVHETIRSNPCPCVVEIADVHSIDGVLMEHCKAGDLQTLMSTGRRRYTPLRRICALFGQIMRGLAHLHSLKICHADISPQNVFLRKNAEGVLESVLGDFGHSYIVSRHAESRSSVADQGAVFVAPEVAAGDSSSMASDIYSAGRILQQMLASTKQFKELFEKESKSLARALENLAKDMMCEKPKGRPSSASVCATLARATPRDGLLRSEENIVQLAVPDCLK